MRMLGMKLGIYNPKDADTAYFCDSVMDKFGDILN